MAMMFQRLDRTAEALSVTRSSAIRERVTLPRRRRQYPIRVTISPLRAAKLSSLNGQGSGRPSGQGLNGGIEFARRIYPADDPSWAAVGIKGSAARQDRLAL